jgi:hypothetical protein
MHSNDHIAPFQGLNITAILYPGRCPGLIYFPLSGEIRFIDIPSESSIIIEKDTDMYIE